MTTPRGPRGVPGIRGPRGESSPYLGKRQTFALAAFIVASFLLLSWRGEIGADRISANAAKIVATQRVACLSGLEILVKFNRQQNALIEIERANPDADPATQAARIRAYEEGRIDPLPICDSVAP